MQFYASADRRLIAGRIEPTLDYFFSNIKPRVVYLYVKKFNTQKELWEATTERYKVYYTKPVNRDQGEEYWEPVNDLASINSHLFLPSKYVFKMQDTFANQTFKDALIEEVDMSAMLEVDSKFTTWFKSAYKIILRDKPKQ